MKLIIKLLIILVVIAAGFYFARNYMVASAVEKGSSYALGVDTDLGSAGLDITGGSVTLTNYVIDNPEGFEAEYFLTIEKAIMDVDEGSILDDRVVVDSFIVEGLHLSVEQIDSKGNYKQLMDHINSLDLGESSESKQSFQVKKAMFKDISVDAAVTLAGNKVVSKSYTVADFSMNNIGGQGGVSIAELTSTMVKKIISQSTVSNQNFLNLNTSQLKDSAKEKVDELKDEATDQLKDLGKSLTGGK